MSGVNHAAMKRKSPDRTGVFVVRLWIEPNHEAGLRARITQTIDTRVPERSVAIAASADDICAVIKSWVDDFVAPGRATLIAEAPIDSTDGGS